MAERGWALGGPGHACDPDWGEESLTVALAEGGRGERGVPAFQGKACLGG